MARFATSDPGPRPLPPDDADTSAAFAAISSKEPGAWFVFLEHLERCRAPLIASSRSRRVHDVEDAVADVIAAWCERVQDRDDLPEPPRDGNWLRLLAQQVRDRLRPRHVRRRAGPRRRSVSLERIRLKIRSLLVDRDADVIPAVDLGDFLAVRAPQVLTPAEYAQFVRLLEGRTDIADDGVDASTRVLVCRLRRRLAEALRAA